MIERYEREMREAYGLRRKIEEDEEPVRGGTGTPAAEPEDISLETPAPPELEPVPFPEEIQRLEQMPQEQSERREQTPFQMETQRFEQSEQMPRGFERFTEQGERLEAAPPQREPQNFEPMPQGQTERREQAQFQRETQNFEPMPQEQAERREPAFFPRETTQPEPESRANQPGERSHGIPPTAEIPQNRELRAGEAAPRREELEEFREREENEPLPPEENEGKIFIGDGNTARSHIPYDSGYIIVSTNSGRDAIPISGATVVIDRLDEHDHDSRQELVAVLTTNQSGRTEPVKVRTVSRTLSQSPGDLGPFVTYYVSAKSFGYYPVINRPVDVFGGETSLLELELIPLPEDLSGGNNNG